MPDANQLVEKAIAAYKAKQKSQARELLMQAVDVDDKHEQAWLWLSAVVDSMEDQQVCLENVLTINPQNDRARKGLEELCKKQGKPLPPQFANPGAAPRTQTSSPLGSGWDAVEDSGWGAVNSASSGGASNNRSNPFAGTGFDANPWGSDGNDALYGATPSPDAPATSVEWNKGGDKSAYGSGRQVSQPSSDEYDQWLASLNLGQGPGTPTPAPPTPPPAPAANPWDTSASTTPSAGAFSFDDSNWDQFSSDLNAVPSSNPLTKKDSDPFGVNSLFSKTEEADTSSPFDFGAPAAKPTSRAAAAEPIEPFQVTTRFTDFADEEDEPSSIFDDEPPSIFGDEDDVFGGGSSFSFGDEDDDPFAKLHESAPVARKPAKTKEKKANPRKPTISPEQAKYFAAIPADITAEAKSNGQGMLVFSTLILLVLNIAAVVGIVMNL